MRMTNPVSPVNTITPAGITLTPSALPSSSSSISHQASYDYYRRTGKINNDYGIFD